MSAGCTSIRYPLLLKLFDCTLALCTPIHFCFIFRKQLCDLGVNFQTGFGGLCLCQALGFISAHSTDSEEGPGMSPSHMQDPVQNLLFEMTLFGKFLLACALFGLASSDDTLTVNIDLTNGAFKVMVQGDRKSVV